MVDRLAGLLIEGIVYWFAWHRAFWPTFWLTLSVNFVSAAAGVAFSLGSVVFLYTNDSIMTAFMFSLFLWYSHSPF